MGDQRMMSFGFSELIARLLFWQIKYDDDDCYAELYSHKEDDHNTNMSRVTADAFAVAYSEPYEIPGLTGRANKF